MVIPKMPKNKEVKNSEEDPITSIKEKCVNCLRGPNLIRTVVVVACTVVVAQQITVSIQKLMNKPISTYTHFDFNETILYPSLTFCREPPYKYDKMLEYGLYAHPRYTSTWLAYNFSKTTLDELWDNITYNETDMFVQYGLDSSKENVEIKAIHGFIYGRCYTISPKIASTRATRASGYSITLQHTARDVATSTSTFPPGYHVHVHYHREPFTEVDVYNGGHVDYFYVNTGDTIDVKLKVDQYVKIGTEDDPCTNIADYSANECTSQYVWDVVSSEAGCSGPWMKSELPFCNNYSGMRRLISAYLNTYTDHNCSTCPRFCRSYLYNSYITDRQTFYTWDTSTRAWSVSLGQADLQTHVMIPDHNCSTSPCFCRSYLYNSYITDRQTFYTWDTSSRAWSVSLGQADLQTHLYIYFNGMLVSVYEERFNYDWNLFISDLGGSIGFLLGLSVIGLMTIFGKVWSTVIRPTIKITTKDESPNSDPKTNTKSAKHEEYIKSCNEWNAKNAF